MYQLILVAFLLGYFFITIEHNLKIDKASISLLTGGVCWTILIMADTIALDIPVDITYVEWINSQLTYHLGEISGILFFLLGAMTIVEVIDAHDGFKVFTNVINTNSKRKLLWYITIISFVLSAILDNLTTAIVMAMVIRKLISNRQHMLILGGAIILSCNAGGAFSPIGDVTTIMLWVHGQISAANIIVDLFLPSLVCFLVPISILSFLAKGDLEITAVKSENGEISKRERRTALGLGLASLLFVPVFKLITNLPPYIGMIISLSVLWIGSDMLTKNRIRNERQAITMIGVMKKLDLPTLFFFLGILLAVSALDTSGHLQSLTLAIDGFTKNIYLINFSIGILSSIVDNVPIVAGAIDMYDATIYPNDHRFWELLAYCAGTGGSILIIGSAAGVAVMGILKIDFMWYLKHMSLLAFLGYVAGLFVYFLEHWIVG